MNIDIKNLDKAIDILEDDFKIDISKKNTFIYDNIPIEIKDILRCIDIDYKCNINFELIKHKSIDNYTLKDISTHLSYINLSMSFDKYYKANMLMNGTVLKLFIKLKSILLSK